MDSGVDDDDGVSSDSGSDPYRNLRGLTYVIICFPLSRTDLTLVFDYPVLFIMRQTKVSTTWAGSSSDSSTDDLGLFHIWQLLNPAKNEVTCHY